MAQNKKTRYGIYLRDELVSDVKDYQRKFAGAENLSGLIESLLNEWVQQQKELEPFLEEFQNKFKKAKEERSYLK